MDPHPKRIWIQNTGTKIQHVAEICLFWTWWQREDSWTYLMTKGGQLDLLDDKGMTAGLTWWQREDSWTYLITKGGQLDLLNDKGRTAGLTWWQREDSWTYGGPSPSSDSPSRSRSPDRKHSGCRQMEHSLIHNYCIQPPGAQTYLH